MERLKSYAHYSFLAISTLLLSLTSCTQDSPEAGTSPSESKVTTARLSFDLSSEMLPITNAVLETPSQGRTLGNGSYGSEQSNSENSAYSKNNLTGGYDPRSNSRVVIRIQDAKDRYMLNDDGQKTTTRNKLAQYDSELTLRRRDTVEMLLIVRAQSTKNQSRINDIEVVANHADQHLLYTYYAAKWIYSEETKTYRMQADFPVDIYNNTKNGGIDENVGVADGTTPLEVMLIAGGESFNPHTKQLKVGFSQVVNLDDPVTELAVPYASDWTPIYRTASGGYKPASTIRLKPYGSLLTFTFRNTSEQNVIFKKLSYIANSLAFGATLDLTRDAFNRVSGNDLPVLDTGGDRVIPETEGKRFSPFYYASQTFSSKSPGLDDAGLQVNKGGALSKTVVVVWALPRQLAKAASFFDGNAPVVGYPQFHAYAEDAVDVTTKLPVAKPNYRIAPIMGTDKTFASGKTYTINCEFYRQPEQPLGYITKGYLNADGMTFTENWTDGSQIPLVSLKAAYDFYDGKKINGVDYYMPDLAWMNVVGFDNPTNFSGNTDPYRFGNANPTEIPGTYYITKGRKNLPVPTTYSRSLAQQFEQIDAVPHKAQQNGQTLTNVALRHAYRLQSVAASSKRSPLQSITVFRATSARGTGSTAGNDYLRTLEVRAFYLGKYFVGNMYETPMNVGIMSADERRPWMAQADRLMTHTAIQSGSVFRRFGMSGVYSQVDDYSLNYHQQSPSNTTRSDVNNLGFYWVRNEEITLTNREWLQELLKTKADNNQYSRLITDFATYHSSNNPYYLRMYTYNSFAGGIFMVDNSNRDTEPDLRQRARNAFFQMLRPYSTTYQGD